MGQSTAGWSGKPGPPLPHLLAHFWHSWHRFVLKTRVNRYMRTRPWRHRSTVSRVVWVRPF